MAIIDYKILHDEYLERLETKVSQMMRQGWIPQGGVSLTIDSFEDGNQLYFAQAMVKHDR